MWIFSTPVENTMNLFTPPVEKFFLELQGIWPFFHIIFAY